MNELDQRPLSPWWRNRDEQERGQVHLQPFELSRGGRCAGLTPANRLVLASTIARESSRPRTQTTVCNKQLGQVHLQPFDFLRAMGHESAAPGEALSAGMLRRDPWTASDGARSEPYPVSEQE